LHSPACFCRVLLGLYQLFQSKAQQYGESNTDTIRLLCCFTSFLLI
jgi:hypothetical protein